MKLIFSLYSRIALQKLISCFIIILISGIFFSCAKKDPFPMRILSVIGKASILKGNSSVQLNENDIINIGDTILTSDKSAVTIYTGSQSAVRIYENSKFTVNARTIDSAGNLNNSDYGLESGKIFLVFKKLLNKGSFSVSTPTTIIAVRGTEFTVDSYNEKEQPLTRIDVVDGNVEIHSKISKVYFDNVKGGETITLSIDRKIKDKSEIGTAEMEILKNDVSMIMDKVNELESKNSDPNAVSTKEKNPDNVNFTAPEEKKGVDNLGKKPPVLKSESQIRVYYSKLERVSLDDGSVIMGAIISQGKTNIKIHTVNGVITVPKNSVVNVVMQ